MRVNAYLFSGSSFSRQTWREARPDAKQPELPSLPLPDSALPDWQAGVVAEIQKLKNSDGPDLVVWGSGNLIQTLLKNDLIDRMHIWTYPITIGRGKKLFAEGTRPERVKAVDGKITSTGVVFATYEPSEQLKEETV